MNRTGRGAEVLKESRAYPVAWTALLAVAALLPLTTSITQGAIGGSYALTDEYYHIPKLLFLSAAVGIATVSWAWEILAGRRELRLGRAHAALAAFGALAVASTAAAPEPAASLFGASGLMTGAVTWLSAGWLGFLVSQYVDGRDRLRQLSWALVGGAAVVAVIALMGPLGLDPLGTPSVPTTAWMIVQGMSTTGNPDFTAVLLIVPTAVSLGLAFSAKDRERWLAGAFAVVMGLAVFVTLVRGAWVALAVALAAFALLVPRERRLTARQALIAAAGAAALLVTGVLVAGIDEFVWRVTRLSGGIDAITNGRAALWLDGARVAARHPLLGTGADKLALGAYEVQREPLIVGVQRFLFQDPHDLPLLLAGVFGIPAALAFLAFVALVVRAALRSRASAGRAPGAGLYAGWLAGLAGLAAASLVSVWTITAIAVTFIALGAVLAPSLRPSGSPVWARAAVALTGVLIAAVAMPGAWLGFSASREVALSRVEDPKGHLERAMALTPWDTGTRVEYYWRKINGSMAAIRGEASASRTAVDALDAELTRERLAHPEELLYHRLRIVLYETPKGYPGYRGDKLEAAIDDALRAFPGDAEFTARRDALAREAAD